MRAPPLRLLILHKVLTPAPPAPTGGPLKRGRRKTKSRTTGTQRNFEAATKTPQLHTGAHAQRGLWRSKVKYTAGSSLMIQPPQRAILEAPASPKKHSCPMRER